MKASFIRIDKEDIYTIDKIAISKMDFDFVIRGGNNKEIKMSKISAVWYRRGDLSLYLPNLDFLENRYIYDEVNHYLTTENKALEHFFYYLMQQKPHIGTFKNRSVNKLTVLHSALNIGLEIPSTYILTSKKSLNYLPHRKFITKGIFEGFRIDIGESSYTTYTEEIDSTTVSESFFSSLFQETIEKEADIRAFYLNGNFYSMAIRSQSDEQTSIDFRKYLTGIGNRAFPFKLPIEIEEKLHKLMTTIGLNTGSIDLVFTKDGRFVFLEVNPVGQFGMTSIPCNYFLEKEIALLLIKMSTSEKQKIK